MKQNADNLVERDAAHVWHPYTQHGIAAPPVPILSARGAHLHTVGGGRLLDCISSWWVTLHGHAETAIADAIALQARRMEQVIFAGFTHEPAVRLAEELIRILPRGMQRVFYTDDGSTAVEVALKMALQYWSNRGVTKNRIVALEGAYHGDTFGAMSVSARGVFNAPFGSMLFEVERLPDPLSADPATTLRELIARRSTGAGTHDVAAIIVEPLLLGAGGMRMWGEEALRRLREAASEAGVLFIADEVLTGFGRTGPLFACDRAGISPDIICLSKGLTGGFLPLGATVTTAEVFDAFSSADRRHTLFHGHSYTANPLACAAALASISLLDKRCDDARMLIEQIHHDGMELLASAPGVRNRRVLGTVAAFDLAGDEGYLSDAGRRLATHCMANGVLIRPLGNVVYLIPPYCIRDQDLRGVYSLLANWLNEQT